MKLDSKEANMNQLKRDKSVDIKETKEKLKQEKLQKEKEKKEREKQEKERKEREKKEKKEREKLAKKGGAVQTPPPPVTNSSTTSALNRIGTQESSGSSSDVATPVLTSSKSDNVLSKLRKNNDAKSKSQQQPQTPPVTKGRYRYQVVYLDETVKTFELEKNALGEDLMTVVCEDLALIEKEYFSLTYRDVNNMKFWLDHEKKIRDQLKGNVSSPEPVFNFEVKFYPPEPNVLQEEITRYLLTLQLRHDIMDGKLPCTFVTHALLGSYTVQAELGDYDEIASTTFRGMSGHEYLEGFCFAPNQTPELLEAIANCHRENKGQTPAEAEMHYLENAVKLAMYGVDLHNAKDSDGVDILVGVSASGLLVFRDHLRINRFAWPKILKISYKRNHFYLKLRPGEFEKYETTIGFRCPNHKAAKRLWKIAVEHHAFFRLREPEKPTKSRIIPTFNSNFRYTGSSTYMQSRHRSIERQQPAFTRSLSKRLTQSMDRGLAQQHPIETPGSVQSAAFNHFNRVKPHMSTSNLGDTRNELRESQEDLEDLDQGGDYNVNERFKPSSHQVTPSRQTNNYQPPNNMPKINPNFLDRFPKDSANFSNRSTDSQNKQNPNSYNPIYQSINKKSTTMPNFNQQQQQTNQSNRLPNEQAASFEHLDEYYTSVDPNTTPSMKHALADSVASLSGSNKISTPILNKNQQQQQQQQSSQRYVPARQVNPPSQQTRQPDLDTYEFDENGNPIEPLPLSPRANQSLNSFRDDDVFLPNSPKYLIENLNNSQLSNLTVSSKYSDTIYSRNFKNINDNKTNNNNTSNVRNMLRDIRNSPTNDVGNNTQKVTKVDFEQKIEKAPVVNIADSEQLSYTKSPVYKPALDPRFQTGSNQRSPLSSDRIPSNQQASSSATSFRSGMEQPPLPRPSQPQQPQPLTRTVRQQPPPIPADRSSISSRDRIQQSDYESQMLAAQQEFEQQKQLNDRTIQILTRQQQQQQQQPQSSRQPNSSSTAISRDFKTNETSKSGSNISTPDANRSKKQIVTEVNHKDLLLKAIQMATDLDPELEVEKVEITTEE